MALFHNQRYTEENLCHRDHNPEHCLCRILTLRETDIIGGKGVFCGRRIVLSTLNFGTHHICVHKEGSSALLIYQEWWDAMVGRLSALVPGLWLRGALRPESEGPVFSR